MMTGNMRRCPECNNTNDTFRVYGTLVTGECTVRLGHDGHVQNVGPIRPTTIIKPGKELSGKFIISCPTCGYSAKPEEFKPSMTSILSGKSTDIVYYIAWLDGYVPICEDEREDANRIFVQDEQQTDIDKITRMLGL